jgi:hypothetical protein
MNEATSQTAMYSPVKARTPISAGEKWNRLFVGMSDTGYSWIETESLGHFSTWLILALPGIRPRGRIEGTVQQASDNMRTDVTSNER